jgi:DNA gyrase/topoisomerase IV subunit A
MAGNVPNTENTTGMFLTKDIAKLDNDDKIVQIFNYTSLDKENYFIFKTSNHTIKKTKVSLYDASSSSS